MDHVGKRIKSECDDRGLSLAELARLADVPKATLHAWTTGREPKLHHLQKVANALKVPLYKLAFGSHDPHEIETDVILKELFSGDIRVTLQKIERRKR